MKNGKSRGRPSAPKATPGGLTLNPYLSLFLIVVVGWVAYSNSFECDFQFDDRTSITENPAIRKIDPSAIWDYSPNRFLPYLSFALNYKLHNLNVFGYHVMNVLIHILNAILVFGLVRNLFNTPRLKNHALASQRESIALFSALLFVSHPVATQAVTYIVQRLAAMAALFYLLSLWLYLKGRLAGGRRSLVFFSGACLSAFCAFISKENSYTLPLGIALIEVIFFQDMKPAALIRNHRFWLSLAAIVVFGFFAFWRFGDYIKTLPPNYANDFREITPISYLLTQFTVIPKYIQLLILPINQNLDYDWPLFTSIFQWQVVLGFLFIISILVWGLFQWGKNPCYAFGTLFFFLAMSIESGFIPIDDLIFEHRTYLSSFGFYMIFSLAIHKVFKNKIALTSIIIFLTIFFSLSTFQRNRIWANNETLWTDVIKKSPLKARPWRSRGYGYMNQGTQMKNAGDLPGMKDNFYKSIYDYSKCIECNPKFIQAYIGRGKIYFDLQLDSLAITDFNKALASDPKNSDALSNRGAALYRVGQYEASLVDLDNAININPKNVSAYKNRSLTHQKLGDTQKAIDDYFSYLKFVPDDHVIYNDIGILSQQSGRLDEAVEAITKAIELKNDFVDAYINRANAFRSQGRFKEAISDYNKAIQINPRSDKAYMNRGVLHQQSGAYRESLIDLTRAIELNPGFAYALYARGVSQYNLGTKIAACQDLKDAARLGNAQALQLVNTVCR